MNNEIEKEINNLRQYLVSDIIRMMLIVNENVDLNQVTIDMLSKSTQKLINTHGMISQDMEKRYVESNGIKK